MYVPKHTANLENKKTEVTKNRMGQALSLVASMVTPLGVGTAIGLGMHDEVKTWYPTIRKPAWYVVETAHQASKA